METKNVGKGQCPNCERPYSLTVLKLRRQKAKREMNEFRLSNEKIQTEQNGLQKTVIRFARYILLMEFQLKQIHSQPCIWATVQKDKKLDALFSNRHYQQRKYEQRKGKWKLESITTEAATGGVL